MSRSKLEKWKGRRGDAAGGFTALPHHIFKPGQRGEPPPVARLNNLPRLLLIDLATQFNGRNNGSLTATPKALAPYGWHSKGSIDRAIAELIQEGFIEKTRQGGRNRRSLYALTWKGIDSGPHDASPNPVASNIWKPERESMREAREAPKSKNASPPPGQSFPAIGAMGA